MFQELTWDASCNPLQDFFSWQEVYGCLKTRGPGPKKCQLEIFYYFIRKNAMGCWTRTFIRLRFLNSIQEPSPRRLGGWAYIEPVKPPTNNLSLWTVFGNHPTKNGHVICVQKPLIRLGSRDDHHNKKHGCMMYPHTTQRTFLSLAWNRQSYFIATWKPSAKDVALGLAHKT